MYKLEAEPDVSVVAIIVKAFRIVYSIA